MNGGNTNSSTALASTECFGYVTRRGYACIGLDNPKNNDNVGGVLRLAGNFGAKLVAISGSRYSKQATDKMKFYRTIPTLHNLNTLKDVIPFDCIPIAIEIKENATSLVNFKHPQRAFYIFGAENATLGDRVTDFCKETIFVPTYRCMNLAVTVAVVLYDRMLKSAT